MDHVLAVTTRSHQVVGIHRTKESAEIQKIRPSASNRHRMSYRDGVKLREESGDVYA